MIEKCVCKSDYQDKRYGKGMRLKTVRRGTSISVCSVCGRGQRPKGLARCDHVDYEVVARSMGVYYNTEAA